MGFIIILIVLLLLLFYFTKSEALGQKIRFYDFLIKDSPIVDICFIAGTHGNEPAGSIALEELIRTGYFIQKSKASYKNIRVIPCVNEWGLRYGVRYQPNFAYPDINRAYMGGEGMEPVSQQVVNLTKNCAILIDFHEGWGFHRMNTKSIGSTISPGETELSKTLAQGMLDKINSRIPVVNKKFVILKKHSCVIPGTLSCHRETQQMHYILIETTGQNNIQPLDERVAQVQLLIDVVCS